MTSASVVDATGDVDVVGAIVEVTAIVDVPLVGGVVDDLYDELVVVADEVVVAADVVADVVVAEKMLLDYSNKQNDKSTPDVV